MPKAAVTDGANIVCPGDAHDLAAAERAAAIRLHRSRREKYPPQPVRQRKVLCFHEGFAG